MLAAVDRLRRATIGGRSRLSKKQSKLRLLLALTKAPQPLPGGDGATAKNSETNAENPHWARYGKPTPKRKSFRCGKPTLQGESGNPHYFLYLGVGAGEQGEGLVQSNRTSPSQDTQDDSGDAA